MFTWAIVGALIVGAPALKNVERKPTKPPAGDWLLERLEEDGYTNGYGRRHSKAIVRFTPTQWKLFSEINGRELGMPEEALAWFDAGGNLEADFNAHNPKNMRKAIWKIEDDKLTICVGSWGTPRPTEYTASKGSGRTLLVFNRNGE